MAKTFNAKILSNEAVAEKIFRLIVDAPELAETARAGQFVQVKISDEFTLRRPLGIASASGGRVKIFYRAVGRGTETLSAKKAGEFLNILGALGNGYTPREGKILLVGGGMGLAPLLCAAEKFSADVLIGGRTKDEVIFWQEEFRPHVEKIFVTTDDGSYAKKGFVIDLLPEVLFGDLHLRSRNHDARRRPSSSRKKFALRSLLRKADGLRARRVFELFD